MKRSAAWFAGLLCLASCTDGGLSTLEIGSGGARLMNGQAATPLEAYDEAYASFCRQHQNVYRNLDPNNSNLFAVREAFEIALRRLQEMRSLAAPADQDRFDGFLARYAEFLKQVERNTWGGSWRGLLQVAEREARTQLHPNQVRLVEPQPGEAPAPARAPAPPPVAKPLPSNPGEKVDVPPVKPPAPAAPEAVPLESAAPPAAPASALGLRLVYKAWDRAHDDLVAAYQAKKDCRQAYEDVTQALRALKDAVPAERRAKLQIYLDYYADVHQKTGGFTTLPEKTSAQDVVDELAVAARVLRKEYHPDK
jgi:hypothetical protein